MSDPSIETLFALRDALRAQDIRPSGHEFGAILGTAKRLIEELRKRGFDVVPATPTEDPAP